VRERKVEKNIKNKFEHETNDTRKK